MIARSFRPEKSNRSAASEGLRYTAIGLIELLLLILLVIFVVWLVLRLF
jgi:flagellar biogenesis protein FliO